MPFVSKSQQAAAFSGGLGPEMKAKAPQWAADTPDIKALPAHAPAKRGSKKSKKHALAQKLAGSHPNPFAKR